MLHEASLPTQAKLFVARAASNFPTAEARVMLQACQSIYPLKDVYIRKVKTLKAPKFDITKLMEVRDMLHSFLAAPPPSIAALPLFSMLGTKEKLRGISGNFCCAWHVGNGFVPSH